MAADHRAVLKRITGKQRDKIDLRDMRLTVGNLPIPPLALALRTWSELAEVDLSHNSLSVFPDALCCASNLMDLNLEYNVLTHLPDQFHLFGNLAMLVLSNNSFVVYPTVLQKMPSLRLIEIFSNPCFAALKAANTVEEKMTESPVLSSRALAVVLQAELLEKDKKIESLEEAVSRLNSQIQQLTSQVKALSLAPL